MIASILLIPIIFSLFALLIKNKVYNRIVLIGNAIIYLIIAIMRWLNVVWFVLPAWLLKYFSFDDVGLYFFSIMSIVFLATSVYSVFYFKESNLTAYQEAVFIAELLFFVVAMSGVILSTHIALLWVFIEGTTLTSALLIYFEKKKSSLEAAWKYVYICSIGIAIAFVGIIVLSIGSKGIDSLFFENLYKYAAEKNPFWLKIAFAFLFVGIGTKIGVAPIHAWLPDAHSEAPSPVSALLSGTLLNSALLGIIRINEIFIQAHQEDFINFFLLLTGFLSLMVSSVFILRVKNYKRMLAYSSIENMGIIFIALGLGKAGIYAAMLHILVHSLSKTTFFLTSGNIYYLYKSKKIESVNGLLYSEPKTAWLWIISTITILGVPPSPAFITKFLIIKALWLSNLGWLIIPFFLFIIFITYGMINVATKMSFGSSQLSTNNKIPGYAYIPQFILLLILIIMGIIIPQQLNEFIINAGKFIG